MVKVRKSHMQGQSSLRDIDDWLDGLPLEFDEADLAAIKAACELSLDAVNIPVKNSEIWCYGTNSYVAGLEIAEILAELQLGPDSIIAGILYRAAREEKIDPATLEKQFGVKVVKLLNGVLRMSAIRHLKVDDDGRVLGQADGQKSNIRKMLVSLVDDVRVALIKLAERTYVIREVKNDPEKRMPVAREVFDIYAPLAHRLGIGQIKWELEDLSFRYLFKDSYKKIAKLLDERRLAREDFIEDVKDKLQKSLANEGVEAVLEGRAKHIYSIWRKMQRKGVGFSQVYDIRALRILVPASKDCYAALGIVHGLWRNIPNEFDDYIANPKENGYRSLHTAVIGPQGKILEVQIRTHDMHEEAELGVCAHWRYKGSDNDGKLVSSYEEKIAWLRQVLEWHEETGDIHNLAEQFSNNVAQDRVYVFTPEGHVVNLTQGATPLDFAYHVHTEVGHNCRGAKVNGSIVPLTYALKTGDRVQILTGKEGIPRRDWLQHNLGYLKTSRARTKVQHWFKQQAKEDNVVAGRALLEREFRRLALTSIDYKRVAETVGCKNVEDMYAAVGSADISSSQVLHAAQSLVETAREDILDVPIIRRERHLQATDVRVRGVGKLLTHMAGCCKPVPGDRIVGYVTVGRGVSVHREDCSKLLLLQGNEPARIIEVDWGGLPENTYPVGIVIEAYDRQGLLGDVTNLFSNARINVTAINTKTDVTEHTAKMRLTVEVSNLIALGQLLARISRLPNVISARRQMEGGVRAG